MKASTRRLIAARAGNTCEYCHISQEHSYYRLQIEHAVPKQHGGPDQVDNLALACRRCNLFKGPNLSAVDPETGEVVALYNPREHAWEDHFAIDSQMIVGRTAIGRAAVRLLRMNDEPRTDLRQEAGD